MEQDAAAVATAKHDAVARLGATRRLGAGGAEAWLREACDPGVAFHGPAPIHDLTGVDAVSAGLWDPLLAALPDLERRPDAVMAGMFKGGLWTAHIGHLVGVFAADLWGVPATRRPVWLRYGAFERIEDGRVAEAYWILDVPGLMMQAGVWPMAPGLGLPLLSPAPASQDGLRSDPGDPGESAASLALVEAMIAGLMSYDGQSLASMGMRRFWTDDFHWYGPGGIGTMRGHTDYERGHQRPFLTAFPDRKGGDHKCRIGDGAYVASTGWPSVRATHTGGGFMGLAPTGRKIGMRVMDVWRCEGDRLVENWVYIDLIDLLAQMGVDVFARMAELTARR
jgi:predicted ester cyclase